MKSIFERGMIAAVFLASGGSLAMTTTKAAAENGSLSAVASSSATAANGQRVQRSRDRSTRGSATADRTRPNQYRNRAGYILNSRQVTFRTPTAQERTAASALRRDGRGNQITRIGSATRDNRSAARSRALADKQAERGAPRINPSSTAELRRAAANGFPQTAASRGATRAGAAPIGSGQVQDPSRQWSTLAAQTAQRNGQQQERPSLVRRVISFLGKPFKPLFRR